MANFITTNKSGKGRKGTIIAVATGTKAEAVIGVIEKTSETTKSSQRNHFG